MLFATAVTTFLSLVVVAATPLEDRGGHKSNGCSSGSGQPIFHSFFNNTLTQATWPAAKDVAFSHLSLAGWRSDALRGAAGSWANLTADARSAILKDYHSLGKTLRVSAFGQNDNVTTNANDPEEVAASLSQFAADYNLDGVDINYEDFAAVASGAAFDWLSTFHAKLHSDLEASNPHAVLTYSPVADWFAKKDDVWVRFIQAVESDVAWINIQFYDNGSFNWTDCTQLLTKTGSSTYLSRQEVADLTGFPVTRIVVQKPRQENQAGFISGTDLGKCFKATGAQFSGVSLWRVDPTNTNLSRDWVNDVVENAGVCKNRKFAKNAQHDLGICTSS